MQGTVAIGFSLPVSILVSFCSDLIANHIEKVLQGPYIDVPVIDGERFAKKISCMLLVDIESCWVRTIARLSLTFEICQIQILSE